MDKEDQYSPQFEEQLKISIHLAERAATKKQLAIIEKKMADKKKPVYWRWMAAATILFAALFATLQLLRGPDFNALFSTYYEPFPNTIAPVERTANADTGLSQAFAYYDAGDYEKAIYAFQQLTSINQRKDLQLYLGISQMALNQNEEARKSFEAVIANKGEMASIATWYLGLLYIKIEQPEKAKPLIQSTAETDNPFANNAQKLENELGFLP